MCETEINEYKTLKEWFNGNLKESANDIANHGADGGFTGIIYTNECVELFDKYAEEIWQLLVETAAECGYDNVMKFIAGFNRKDMFNTLDEFKNLLVWFACEQLAQEIVIQMEET